MEKLSQQTLTDRVYDRLLAAFTDHELKPGERLKLEDLAMRMDVSPTPLRHALARLEAEGIVRAEPRRGIHVVSYTPTDMANLYEARLMCETHAAEKATSAITDAQLDHLREILNAYEGLAHQQEPAARRGWVRKDVEYHRYIVDLAGNATISSWFRTLSVHVQTLLLSTSADRDPSVSMSEHRKVYEALAARDAAACTEALSAHIIAARDNVLRLMTVHTANSDGVLGSLHKRGLS
jgi:DNA-binding GntR family transcriptional regulator